MVVCIVSHEDSVAALLSEIVTDEGWVPVAVRSAEEVRAADLIIGFGCLGHKIDREVLERIHLLYPETPVLYLGTGMERDMLIAGQYGACYLSAPFNLDELLTTLRVLVRRTEAERTEKPGEPAGPKGTEVPKVLVGSGSL